MIEELLSWVQLLSQAVQQSRAVTSQNLSNVIFIAYLLTIRKSYLFGAAFLLCEVMAMLDVVPQSLSAPIYGLSFYCIMLFCWLIIATKHILVTTNKNTLICCVIMILFLLYMAWDSYINAYTETFAWRHYEDIILCIHVCIIVSLYRPRAIFNNVVGKFFGVVDMLRNNYAVQYFWYTVRYIKQKV